jgi:hypothetical protein
VTLPFTGSQGLFRCGFVFDVLDPVAWIEVDFVGTGGDSGSGFVGGTSNTWEGLYMGGTAQHAFFEPAYYVKRDFGLTTWDFNCVKSGSAWIACPVVM